MAKIPRADQHVYVVAGEPLDGNVQLSNGDWIPRLAMATIWIQRRSDYGTEYKVELGLEIVDGQPTISALSIVRGEHGGLVTAALLRSLDVERLLSEAVVAHVVNESIRSSVQRDEAFSFEERLAITDRSQQLPKRRPITRDLLVEVASVYKAADRAPTDAVRTHFHVSPRTAARWVDRAANAGLLPKTTQGKRRKAPDGKHR